MKTFKEFVNEAKQVGIVYHYTSFKNFKSMVLAQEPLVLMSLNGETVSTTRNVMLHLISKDPHFSKNARVRIALDGNKLSNNHKIRPVAGLTDNESDVLSLAHNEFRVKRSSGEAEEAIFKLPLDIKPYIIRIDILAHRDNTKDFEELLLPILKKYKIQCFYDRHINEIAEDTRSILEPEQIYEII